MKSGMRMTPPRADPWTLNSARHARRHLRHDENRKSKPHKAISGGQTGRGEVVSKKSASSLQKRKGNPIKQREGMAATKSERATPAR